jgi:high-affinity Fe2+/Pb2+ permease
MAIVSLALGIGANTAIYSFGRAHMVKEREHFGRLAAAVARVMETA